MLLRASSLLIGVLLFLQTTPFCMPSPRPAVTPGQIQTCIELLKHEVRHERAKAAMRLAELGTEAKEALPDLEVLLPDHEISRVDERNTTPGREAAIALWRITGSLDRVMAALDHEKHRARSNAAAALAEIGDPTAVPALIDALDEDRWPVEQALVRSLASFGTIAVDPLLEALRESDDWRVRAHAVWALGEIGDQRAAGPVRAATDDPVADVRIYAANALFQITGERITPRPGPILSGH